MRAASLEEVFSTLLQRLLYYGAGTSCDRQLGKRTVSAKVAFVASPNSGVGVLFARADHQNGSKPCCCHWNPNAHNSGEGHPGNAGSKPEGLEPCQELEASGFSDLRRFKRSGPFAAWSLSKRTVYSFLTSANAAVKSSSVSSPGLMAATLA
jgi:hypothetical protein